ncbi:type VII secretion protein EccB [Pseudonocardia adelaidensis]|uniref:Type VII secretion protein EccB n=1 Tax=Pseudonocardia adelaidensis TaxID=648754 RepID=A0ABP9P5E6_9PSEU
MSRRANAVPAPATRDQADAYRFGLRRLEAALVRGDPVPLHEQIRSQRRAALAGVVLGLLGLCGAAVLAAVSPQPDWTHQAVVVGASSGAMYAVAHDPDRLVPVANLPAARLVLAALRAGGSTDVDPAGAVPVRVPDPVLDGAPRTPAAAVPGALAVRPGGPPVPPSWAVCDSVTSDGALAGTTVIGGAAPPAPDRPEDGVLLDAGGATWLVTAGRRHRVDTADGRATAALGITGRAPRAASPALLSLLPEGPPLVNPAVPGRGLRAPDGLPGRVGDVLVARPPGGAAQHYVVLAGGVQEVPAVLAELLVAASGSREPRPVGAADLAGAAVVDELPVAGWPDVAPRVVEGADAPVLCWTWAAGGDPAGAVGTGPALPLAGRVPVQLAQADGPGDRLDAAAVGPGGAVRETGPGGEPDPGRLWLVSGSGVAHRVADEATAAALGITAAEPAPEGALRLLPTGPTLDLAAAGRVVDVLPVP